MIDSLLATLAPHLCLGCGQIGSLMCDSCKNDIVNEEALQCVVCERPAGRYLCRSHATDITQGWYVAQRTGSLEQLIDALKFERARAAYRPLAELLLARLPDLPASTVIVPIPTVTGHVRQRGYDHMRLIGQHVARRRGLALRPVLRRKTATTQRDANRRQRERQAREAFRVTGPLDSGAVYLLIDDVATTGATLRYAAQALKAAGAQTVWVATIARQPLD